ASPSETSPIALHAWRSLARRDRPLATDETLRDEFQRRDMSELLIEPTDRRNFIGILSASVALAGAATLPACVRKPQERILPYAQRPEDLIPGKARYFATAAQVTGSVIGLLVESQDGRPTKIEGNPRHPNSHGATDTFTQASILDLYDPARIKAPRVKGKALSFARLDSQIASLAATFQKRRGRGLALLTRDLRSPMFLQLLTEFSQRYPEAKIYRHDPANPQNALAGLALLGEHGKRPYYNLSRAERILSLDHDLLGLEGDTIRQARDFAAKRSLSNARDTMSRLYVVEPTLSITGSNADHRLRLPASQVGEFLADLLGHMAATGINGPAGSEATFSHLRTSFQRRRRAIPYTPWLRALSDDLLTHRRRSLVLVGERQPPRVHALGHLLNALLESYRRTLDLFPVAEIPAHGDAATLAQDIREKRVDTLISLGVNAVYDASGNLAFSQRFAEVPTTIALALREDETTHGATWVIPKSHYLETWGELVTDNGHLTIQQPLIDPLYPSLSEIELLARLCDRKERKGYALVHGRWAAEMRDEGLLALTWRQALHDGVRLAHHRPPAPTLRWNGLAAAWAQRIAAPKDKELELVFALDATLYDGRFAQNAWLQELPDPITKLAWDNALLVGIATAKSLGLANEDLVEIATTTTPRRKLQIPVWIVPGVADNTLILPLGYGRGRSGPVAKNAGFDAYSLRSHQTPSWTRNITLKRSARGSYRLASTQEHGTMVDPGTGHRRPVALEASLADYRHQENKKVKGGVNFAERAAGASHPTAAPSKTPSKGPSHTPQWGMSIDLSACIGCNACTLACQAENNISVVGKREVQNGREMHWLRLDRYFISPRYRQGEADDDDVRVITQPLACQQCEDAPCESVCPLGATSH
ncbi:MAG: 4Fe-4S dicluster domain-containing protein, partial [Deltaproteobacteria bacterium]|nr:4Fe-4S dicluster domain-containing protein [Deltaproteobacteria bacterium]